MKLLFASFISVLLIACNNHKTEVVYSNTYKYEPDTSALTGTLTEEIFWGPPNFGEDTTIDAREPQYVLTLNTPINILPADSDFNGAQTGIKKLQVVSSINLDKYVNKKVKVTGRLWGAQTGHHHTEVLITLLMIE